MNYKGYEQVYLFPNIQFDQSLSIVIGYIMQFNNFGKNLLCHRGTKSIEYLKYIFLYGLAAERESNY
jgi:hypothetical protein